MKRLSAFIRNVGVDDAAKLFDESPRQVKAWLYQERMPRPRAAQKIERRTRNHPAGPVSISDIYGGVRQ